MHNFRSGYIGPVAVVVFFIIATVINKILMSPVVHFVFLQERMEGNFRLVYCLRLIPRKSLLHDPNMT